MKRGIQIFSAVILFAILVLIKSGEAQQRSLFIFSETSLPAQNMQPAFIWDDSLRSFKYGFDLHTWTGNSGFYYKFWLQFIQGKTITVTDVDKVIRQLRPRNILGFGFETDILHVNFRIKQTAFSVDVQEKSGVNLFYSDTFFSLMWKGNKQFEGETADFGDLKLNASSYLEIGIGAARKWNDFLTAGLRIKYLMGIANIYTERGRASLYTAPDGDYWDIHADYKVNQTSVEQIITNQGDFSKLSSIFPGRGMAFDIGGNYWVNPKIEAGMSITDLGWIKWKKETTNYSASTTYHFEGFEVDTILQPLLDFSQDSLLAKYSLDTTYNAYVTGTPVKINLMGKYTIREGKLYTGLHYVQGLNKQAGNSTRPYFAAVLEYHPWRFLTLGYNVGYGGFNRLSMGALISVRGWKFIYYIASENFLGAAIPGIGTGLDFETGLQLQL